MDEKRKLVFTILVASAGLFFLIANLCLPLVRNNAELAANYKKLRQDVKSLEAFDPAEIDSLEKRLDSATADIEQRFPPKGKLKLVERLTQKAKETGIEIKEIKYRDPYEEEGYRVFPVDFNMQAAFYDFLAYLGAIEKEPLMIGLQNLSLNRLQPGADCLNIRATFLGYRLTKKADSISKYLEQGYSPLNTQRLDKVLQPVKQTARESYVLKSKDFNPFISVYDLERSVRVGVVEPKTDALSLMGILRVGKERVALINDKIVREGEIVAGAQVEEIQDFKVILNRLGKKYILKMGVEDGIIKR